MTAYAHRRQREAIVEGSRDDARAEEARLLLSLGGAPASRSTDAPFCDFLTGEYAAHAHLHLGARTWRRLRRYQVASLAAHFGQTPLSQLTSAQVDAYKLEAQARGVGPAAINNDLKALRAMLNFARKRGYAVASLHIVRLTEPRGRAHAWSLEELSRLLEATRRMAPHRLPLLLFLANTGCRKGEAVAARWDWVDLRGRMLRIPANRAWRPKSGRAREVPLSDSLAAVLRELPRQGPWLFPRRDNGEGRASFPQDEFTALRKAARLSGGPHTLRHTFASLFLRAKPDLPLLGRIMGHSTTRVTELYAHMLPGHLDEARNVVDVSAGFGATLAVRHASTRNR